MGLFGDIFDFNHDGKLDNYEKAVDFSAFSTLMDDMEEEDRRKALQEEGLDPDSEDDFNSL